MRDLAGHVARLRGKLTLAFFVGLASGALIALITRALADEPGVIAPFAAHAARHAVMVGLLTVAAALVVVAIRRSAQR